MYIEFLCCNYRNIEPIKPNLLIHSMFYRLIYSLNFIKENIFSFYVHDQYLFDTKENWISELCTLIYLKIRKDQNSFILFFINTVGKADSKSLQKYYNERRKMILDTDDVKYFCYKKIAINSIINECQMFQLKISIHNISINNE